MEINELSMATITEGVHIYSAEEVTSVCIENFDVKILRVPVCCTARDLEQCEQQIARCVSQKEYYEGPASCAGFKCPQGNHCILRESFCVNPPCKLIQTCMKNKDVQLLFVKCRNLGCPSEYECFLRKPESDCASPPCRHTPDCIMATENEMTNVHCRGWVCPRMQTCSAKIVESCETNDCNIKRICHESHAVAANDSSSSFSRRSLKNKDEISLNDTEISGNTDEVKKAE
ncbi:hypothetical protein K0M31_014636 [Melipona bicolor]|uniref:Uncharacterized protein n=1 Tax=Melipona bicolor TaxID=60889 RepID=A0AA40FGZ3_9HYME|nr:hypothetical protein K0M31_014636 [Melipona bicolor]